MSKFYFEIESTKLYLPPISCSANILQCKFTVNIPFDQRFKFAVLVVWPRHFVLQLCNNNLEVWTDILKCLMDKLSGLTLLLANISMKSSLICPRGPTVRSCRNTQCVWCHSGSCALLFLVLCSLPQRQYFVLTDCGQLAISDYPLAWHLCDVMGRYCPRLLWIVLCLMLLWLES